MMEHTTDRLFWTLTSIIVGALILTIGINAFPKATQGVIQPISGVIKQADRVESTTNDANNKATSDAANFSVNGADSQATDPDAQAKANAVEASTLGFTITDNGDGTASISKYDASKGTNVNVPEYVKNNGTLLKITNIGDYAFYNESLASVTLPNSIITIGRNAFALNQLASITIPNSVTSISQNTFSANQLTSITIPNSVTNIGQYAFSANQLTSITIPNSVTNIAYSAFGYNSLSSVNIPNAQGYQSAQSNQAFDSGVTVTNNPSTN